MTTPLVVYDVTLVTVPDEGPLTQAALKAADQTVYSVAAPSLACAAADAVSVADAGEGRRAVVLRVQVVRVLDAVRLPTSAAAGEPEPKPEPLPEPVEPSKGASHGSPQRSGDGRPAVQT